MSKQLSSLCGPINIMELAVTINSLKEAFGEMNNHAHCLVGSSADLGKKSFMGDVDIAIDANRTEFTAALKETFGDDRVSSSGVVSLVFPIAEYRGDCGRADRKPNVQIDFIFGDPAILYLTYYSPDKHGKLKQSPLGGGHRNAIISSYFSLFPLHEYESDEPAKLIQTRFKWSMTGGMQLIVREFQWNVNKEKFIRCTQDVVLYQFEADITIISKAVFGVDGVESVFDSAEDFLTNIAKYKGESVASKLINSLGNNTSDDKWTEDQIEYLREFFNGVKISQPVN